MIKIITKPASVFLLYLSFLSILTMSSVFASDPPPSFQHVVTDGTTSYTVDYELHSSRGPNLEVLIEQDDGTFLTHTPGVSRTYIGHIASLPGAMASALRRADGSIHYTVMFANGVEWINNGSTTNVRGDTNWPLTKPFNLTKSGGAGSSVIALEVGVDIPHAQYVLSEDPDAILEMIEYSVNSTNLVYLRDANIFYRVGRVILRGDALKDPYAGVGRPNDAMAIMWNHWKNILPADSSLSASSHDVGVVASYTLDGGNGYGPGIGTEWCYSGSESGTDGNFYIVWRHEVAHNWNVFHGESGAPEGATINSGNSLGKFSGAEQATMIDYRNGVASKLENIGAYPVAIPPRASLDSATYPVSAGTVTIDVLDNDHDSNGDTFSITSFQNISDHGGMVSLSVGTGPQGRDQLVYNANTSDQRILDRFSYTITDSSGREGVGYVIVSPKSDDDLLVHFPFDSTIVERRVTADASPRRHDARIREHNYHSINIVPGIIGNGIKFTNGLSSLFSGALNEPSNTVTYTAWIKTDGIQDNGDAVISSQGGSTVAGLLFGANNELRYVWDNNNTEWSSGLNVPDNVWTFVALAVSPDQATLYMDSGGGMEVATHSTSHPVEAFDTLLAIGGHPRNNGNTLRAILDDVRIFNRTLSAVELTAMAEKLGTPTGFSPPQCSQQHPSNVELTWDSSPGAISHRVYFSDDYNAVRTGAVGSSADQGTVTTNSWSPPALSNSTKTYYWRVDSSDGTTWLKGAVYTFAVDHNSKINLVGYNPKLVTGTGNLPWTSINPKLEATSLSATGPTGLYYTADRWSMMWRHNREAVDINKDYISFTVTPSPNTIITPTLLTLPIASWSGPVNISVRTSVDNFAGNGNGSLDLIGADEVSTNKRIDLSSIGSQTTPIEIRIYLWGDLDSGTSAWHDVIGGAGVQMEGKLVDLSQSPAVNSGIFATSENSPVGTTVGTVSAQGRGNLTYAITAGNSGDEFAIDANTGVITTASVLDYEILNNYALRVTVTDTDGLTGTASVYVSVTNVTTGDDSDNDSMDDDWEVTHFGDTTSQTGSGDADNDGLNNAGEFAANTNPNSTDTDADGFSDEFEVDQLSDPNSDASTPDTLLAAFWDFDNSAISSETKDRVGAIQGSIVSGAAYTSDAGGRSAQPGDLGMDFGTTAAGQRVDVASAAFLNTAAGDDKLTISYWQKLTSTGFTSSSFWAVSPSSPSEERGIQTHTPWSNNRIYFDMGGAGAGSRIEVDGSSVTWTDWNHIALVKNGSTAEIWINGVKLHTLSGMSALKTDISRLVIGASGTGGNSLRGVIDDFAIFKTALDSVQIANLVSGASPVDIVETPNQAPVATDSSLAVSENSSVGTTVGAVTATDPGNTLSYAITAGNGGGEFVIDSNSGVITTTVALDYEATASYALTVTVTDDGSPVLSDTATVTVNVTNVNEAPTANNSSGTIAEDASIGATVANVTSVDPDAGDSVTYAITAGNAGSVFAINSTSGEITTAAALDFETTPNYVLTVSASDNGGLTDTASVNITVEDVVEVTLPSVSTGIAQNVTQTSADIDFSVTNDGGEAPVLTLYYGLTNGGVNTANWSNSTSIGAQGVGSYSAPLSGLSPGQNYYYTIHASNSAGETWGSSSSFTTEADTSPKLVRTTVNGVSSSSWTTVNLGQNYNSAVIVATPIYPDSSGLPVVTRIRNVTSNSFEVKIDVVDGSSDVGTIDVSIIAVEEGVYTQANDGVTMEAVKYTSSVTSYKNSWTAEARSYQNSYTTPVVVGQVMSANDAEWSTFWCQGGSRTSPPSATSLNVGKHVGEDSLTARADETIGYIVIESGNGTINGIAYSAGLGGDNVRGTGNTSTGYSYSLSGLSSASAAAVSIAGMDGGDGGWAVLYGPNPLSATQLTIAVDEDQYSNSERKHTTEQCGYIVFE